MKPKTMILMVVAVGCGLAASYMTSQLLADRNKPPPPVVEQEKVKILVAKRDLKIGELINDPRECFKEKLFLKGEEPAKALTDKDYDRLKDHRLVKPISTDQFVAAEDLLDKNQNSLAARLPPGMRAVGLRVDIHSIAGGFASLPMSNVDIVSTLRRGDGDSVSQILLENVLVLAADDQAQRDPNRPAMPASTVTVALNPQDAELVTLAQEMGSLRLILRGPGDTKAAKTKGVHGELIVSGNYRDRDNTVAKNNAGGTEDDEEKGDIINKLKKIKERRGEKAEPGPKKEEPKKEELKKEEPKKEEPKKEEPKKEEPPPAPKTRTHVLTIYNGPQGRRYPFKLDADGQVVKEEITQEDPEPPPPQVKKKPKPVVQPPKAPKGPTNPTGDNKKGQD
jgi:pilus assembly protein CpaB